MDNENYLFMDYLGPGSIVGQYSILGNDEALFGLRAKMASGTTILSFDKKTFQYLRQRKNELDVVLMYAEDEIDRFGTPQIDYLIFNDKEIADRVKET